MKPISTIAIALVLVTGCDTDESSTQAPTDEFAQADTDAAQQRAAEDGEHWKHRGKRGHNPAEHLCADLGCTDPQRTQIEALFERGSDGKRERPDHSEADAALADAFRGSGFSAADIEAHRTATKPAEGRGAKHLDKMAQLHGILNEEQRNALAEKIETEGFMGPRGRHGKHGKRGRHDRGEKDPERMAQHLQRRVERMCEPLSCTDEQVTKLTSIVSQAKADKPPRPDKDEHRQALAKQMRSETFDANALRTQFDNDEGRAERHAMKADVLVAIHGVLDSNQRGIVADEIEEHGPRALMGKRHRKGKRRR